MEFINTVHLEPKSTGFLARRAFSVNSPTSIPILWAKVSRKLPQPEEHASLSKMELITPSSTFIAFISCPPISTIKSTSGL